MRVAIAAAIAALGACGDNALPRAPRTLAVGPVSIDTQTMTLTLAGSTPLVQPRFLATGTANRAVDELHYYTSTSRP